MSDAGLDVIRSFLERAAAEPAKPYFRCGSHRMSYGAAAAAFLDLAQNIHTRGWVGDRRVVAVSLENPQELLFTIWACLLSDTSLVFCPRTEDSQRMRATMQANGAEFLLTDIPALFREPWVVNLPQWIEASGSDKGPKLRFEAHASTESAFLFQTSGTEGEPKWVKCRYSQCFAAVECMWREGALDHVSDQTVYLTAPLYHSYGLSSMLEYTRGGSSLVLPAGNSPLGPVGELGDRPLAAEITAVEGVPYFHVQFSRLASRFGLPRLRHLGFGGGGLDLDVIERLRAVHPALSYSVRYGLTETPSVVSHKVFHPPYEQNWRSSGRIMPIYQVQIMDDLGLVLGPNQEGEIVVRGPSVASYTDRVAPTGVEATLRTGDFGYLTPEGELFVVGRGSAFLKHRGFRLSPEQIEGEIRSFDGIQDCRVVMRDSRLVAEVVCGPEPVSGHSLLNYLSERLPDYAVPDAVERVGWVPRTPSGKIKRHG